MTEITDQTSPQPPPQTKPEPEPHPQPLCRPIQDRMLAGVAVAPAVPVTSVPAVAPLEAATLVPRPRLTP